MIVIIDYGMGNLSSIKRKLIKNGFNAVITSNIKDIEKADHLILPGVGHFQKAIENINKLRIREVLDEAVLIKKKPVLGICLGMQIMALHSEEGDAKGLGWIDANVIRFKVRDNLKFKIPHIGWNQVKNLKESRLMYNLPNLSEFYFVHSYYLKCNLSEDILSETVYETIFTSAVEKENIIGVQYHPEKSYDAGNLLFANFLKM